LCGFFWTTLYVYIKGSNVPSPSEITVDAERTEAQRVSSGWLHEGHPAHKNSYQKPLLGKSREQSANPSLPGEWPLKTVYVRGHSVSRRMKTALRETQTLRAGCSKAEPKNFAPPQAPSRGRRTAKI